MSLRPIAVLAPLFCVVTLMASSSAPLGAQYGQPASARPSESVWENDRMLVRTVSLEPGARLAGAESRADRVVVFLTGDLDGRMPASEAIWQPADASAAENRGPVRVEALVVDMKPGAAAAGSGTPLEALWTADGATARTVIDNDRVAVLKLRYPPYALTMQPPHAHAQDALVVYLSGGYTWLPSGGWGYPTRVRRGEFDVIPANTLHSLANGGGDGLEFLVILPK